MTRLLCRAQPAQQDCGQYDKSLSIFRNVENIAPHFSLWFKKDFAWTYLIAKFEKNDKAYAQAKTYIKNQIKKNYDEPGFIRCGISYCHTQR